MNIISDPSPDGDFFPVECAKSNIVLHFTAGYSLNSADNTLDRIDQVAVAYIIDTTGDIYHKFNKMYYAYHLGMKTNNPGHIMDKQTIGIEIVNIGPVWLKNGVWYDYVGRRWDEKDVVIGNDRGTNGSVKFTKEQIDATVELCDALFTKVPTIPRLVPKEKLACQVPAICKFKGLTSHQMYRKDKYDTGVAMPWNHLIKELKLKEVSI